MRAFDVTSQNATKADAPPTIPSQEQIDAAVAKL